MLLVLPWYQASVVSCVINYLRIATLQFIGTNLNLLALLRVILFETAHLSFSQNHRGDKRNDTLFS